MALVVIAGQYVAVTGDCETYLRQALAAIRSPGACRMSRSATSRPPSMVQQYMQLVLAPVNSDRLLVLAGVFLLAFVLMGASSGTKALAVTFWAWRRRRRDASGHCHAGQGTGFTRCHRYHKECGE